MNNYAIFSHFNPNCRVEHYVLTYISALAKNGYNVIFVSTSRIQNDELSFLEKICKKVIMKKNTGFDFYSWKVGYKYISKKQIDKLIFCNDSCYVSKNRLTSVLKKLSATSKDLCCITESYDYKHHLQSYFIFYSKKIVHSKEFKLFVDRIEEHSDRKKVVSKYELQFMNFFKSRGFKTSVLIKYSHLEIFFYGTLAKMIVLFNFFKNKGLKPSKKNNSTAKKKILGAQIEKILEICWLFLNPLNVNPSLYLWKENISRGSPFIKTHLFKANPFNDKNITTDNMFLTDNGFILSEIKQHLKNMGN